jgi:hypothetical protein
MTMVAARVSKTNDARYDLWSLYRRHRCGMSFAYRVCVG